MVLETGIQLPFGSMLKLKKEITMRKRFIKNVSMKFFSAMLIVTIMFCFGSPNLEMAYAITGTPGSTKTTYNPDGSVKQERVYGDDGRAEKDVDYNHGGVGHTFPHEHNWDWSTDPPTRQEGIPVPPTPCPAPTPDQSSNTGKTGVNDGQTGSNTGEVVEKAAVGAVVATALYLVVSEGLRIVFPLRNLIPVP